MNLSNHISRLSMPIIIRDNFLPQTTLDFVLNEVKRSKSSYSREGYNHKKTLRDSLDPRYCGTQYISNPRNILRSIWDRYFWSEIEMDFVRTRDSGFIQSLHTQHGPVLLSAYGNGDYYGPHIDIDMGNIITAVLMLSFNKKFTGGDLRLEQEVTIPFKNNTLIVFPACMEHEVTKIELESTDYTDQRFSLQYFISAVPLKKPLVDESRSIK